MFRHLVSLCYLLVCIYACEKQPHIQNSYCDSEFVAFVEINSWNNKAALDRMIANGQNISDVDFLYNATVMVGRKSDPGKPKLDGPVQLKITRPSELCQGIMRQDIGVTYLIFGKYLDGKTIEVHRNLVVFTVMVGPNHPFIKQLDEIDKSKCVCEVRRESGGGPKPACIVASDESQCNWTDGVCKFEDGKCKYQVDPLGCPANPM